ncbi:nuclear pore complex protein NUP85-like [Castanea sativa]|uniref:nuclear pore complex protein NUP85-like n=1 Tax=Castanea sativa TaxID=21020 RepID=UPI003F65118E
MVAQEFKVDLNKPLVYQIAPIYLASCLKQGMGLLEILLRKQPVQNNQVLLKIIEICHLYELDSVSSNIMKVVPYI